MEIDLQKLVKESAPYSVGVRSVAEDLATRSACEQKDYINRSIKVYIRQILKPEEQELLRKRFGNYSLHLTHEMWAPHGFAAASRHLETLEALDSFPPDDLVVDFGGNWYFHFAKHKSVHSCCPLLDIRDHSRHRERLMALNRLLQMHGERYRGEEPNFCCCKAEECTVKSLWAIIIHGAYDMGFKNVCAAMLSHGTQVLKGTLIMDPLMLISDEGIITELNCRWKKTSDGYVKYDFQDEMTNSYVHRWEYVKSFLTDQVHVIQDSSGYHSYLLERMVYCNGIMTFKVTHVPGNYPSSTIRHCVWFEKLHDYVGVRIVDPTHPRKWRTVNVARDTLRDVEEIAFRCFKESRDFSENLKTMASALAAKSTTTIINGMSIHSGERLPIDVFHLVALTITLHAEKKFRQIKTCYDMLSWRGYVKHFWEGATMPLKDCIKRFMSVVMPSASTYFDDIDFIVHLTQYQEFENEYSVEDGVTVGDYLEKAKQQSEKAIQKHSLKMAKNVKNVENSNTTADIKSEDALSLLAGSSYSSGDSPAILEFANYNLAQHNAVMNNLRSRWLSCSPNDSLNIELLRMYHLADNFFNIRMGDGRWLYEPKTEYSLGYNIDLGLVPIEDGKIFVVDKNTVICNHHAIYSRVKSLKKVNFKSHHVDGVAGCGKTTKILADFNMNTDCIVTANKKSAEDIKESLKVPEDLKDLFVQTSDSVCMHGLRRKSQRILMDEVGLMHDGQVQSVMALSGASELICYGDSEQISFKNRDPSFRMQYQQFVADTKEYVTKTYRCPRDSVLGLSWAERDLFKSLKSKYLNWYTTSKVEKSLVLKPISSILEIPIEEDCHYMTWTQADKAALQSRAKELKKTVKFISNSEKTVHESQGVSVKRVRGVRLRSTKCGLASDPEYVRVMLSRHTHSFEYYVVGAPTDDAVVKICKYTDKLNSTDGAVVPTEDRCSTSRF